MQITNNYDKEVFNGDIGRIIKLDLEMQEMKVRFDDRVVAYEYADLDELVLAYAVSIHKSQGSDYPAVVIGAKKALAIAVNNARPQQRYTFLDGRLRD